MTSGGAILVASIPGHSHQGQTYSRLSHCNSRLPVTAESTNNDKVESPSRDHITDVRDMGFPTVDVFATVHNTKLPRFMSPS